MTTAPYDLLLRGGHVVDPASGLDGVADVAVTAGKIAAVGPNLPGPARPAKPSASRIVPMVTTSAAAMVGLQDEIGTLRPGAVADVSVLADDLGRFKLGDNEGTEVIADRKRYDAAAPHPARSARGLTVDFPAVRC